MTTDLVIREPDELAESLPRGSQVRARIATSRGRLRGVSLDVPTPLDERFDSCEEMQRLLADLPKSWATVEGDPVQELLGPHLRAAYGKGYSDALAEPTSCPIAASR